MRCSMRESHTLQPGMFTSTPISKPRTASVFNFFENSPIYRSNPDLAFPKQLIKYQNQKKEHITVFKVLGDQKIPLIKEKRGSSFQKSALSHPPMVVISDSEEEIDKVDTLPPNSNTSNRSKSVGKMDMDQPKESVKRIKNRNALKSLKENLLESENKISQKRISRVDTIIEEIMKERKSIVSPSPSVKVKSEYCVDAIVEEAKNDLEIRRVTRSSVLSSQALKNLKENEKRFTFEPNILVGVPRTKAVEVTRKLQDIGNIDKINNIRRTRKTTQSIIKKEKAIQHQEVKKLTNCENLIFNVEKNQPHSTPEICSGAEQLNGNLPVFYNQEEICDNQWIQVKGQVGVFLKKNFRNLSISSGFVKIEAKCSFLLHSIRFQIFNVAEGKGIFVYDNNLKVKIEPGHTVSIPAGFPCKIINSGFKKNLVLSFVKIYNE